MDSNLSYITRQDILNFPFPYKLWLVVHLDYCEFLRWNRDGTVILLDLVALEDYLNSTKSIFKIKNNSTFLQHLEEFQFERLNAKPEAAEDLLLQYKHENFQRHRLDLLAKIRRHIYQLIGETSKETEKEAIPDKDYHEGTIIPKHVSERMLGDLCFMSHGSLSKIKKSRLRFQTVLQFHNEKRILKDKLKNTAESTSSFNKSKASGNSMNSEDDHVIELPVDMYENPHDSVLYLNDEFRPEYAGYYGNCAKEQIMQFFGEYLPRYEDGSMQVKKVVGDNGATNNSNLNISESNILQNYSQHAMPTPNIFISTPVNSNSVYNLNFSANFEPIYITDINENSENINPSTNANNFTANHLNTNCYDNEADISMEEFIKFKDKSNESVANNTSQLVVSDCDDSNACAEEGKQEDVKSFPQMPAAVQMEITGDVKENEASFRNFFSQYRASLNLLYERQ